MIRHSAKDISLISKLSLLHWCQSQAFYIDVRVKPFSLNKKDTLRKRKTRSCNKWTEIRFLPSSSTVMQEFRNGKGRLILPSLTLRNRCYSNSMYAFTFLCHSWILAWLFRKKAKSYSAVSFIILSSSLKSASCRRDQSLSSRVAKPGLPMPL
jgi:hypothetical protein